ncbi:hypothetical protein JXA56_03285 [Candidatus Micrarchaeota archaeon]|nr:hypothetical protein [Candidatus Micrarchaeota archaeon]
MEFKELLIIILGIGLVGMLALMVSGYLTITKTDSGEVIVKYTDPDTGEEKMDTATKLENGSYRTAGGMVLPRSSDLQVVRELSSSGVCNCDCCDNRCEKPCTEPEPLERYLCPDGSMVKNRAHCDPSCNVTAIGKVFICADGSQVKDPQDCGGVAKVLYVCENGEITELPEECGCSGNTAVACIPAVVEKKYECVNGAVVGDPDDCPGSYQTMYYICSDQRRVERESECSAVCIENPAVPVTTLARLGAADRTDIIGIVYECWNGAIVNNKADCQLYCERGCECPDYERPVCGTDGRTYRNRCLLSCAGIGYQSEGECPEYQCIEQGQPCSPVRLVTLAANMAANQTYCCPGLECLGTTAAGTALTHVDTQQTYTCQPPQVQCTPQQGSCKLDSECCDDLACNLATHTCEPPQECIETGGICRFVTGSAIIEYPCCEGSCNPQTKMCEETPLCIEEGERCVYTATAAPAVSCCSGLYCNPNGYCQRPDRCSSDGAACRLDSECCSGYCDADSNKCSIRPGCFDTYHSCTANSECCSGYCNRQAGECWRVPPCNDECKNGVLKYNCIFDAGKGVCVCETEYCESQQCNTAGTACAEASPQCIYEYCSNGVLYSGCYFNQNTGGCYCPTQIPCQSKRCNTAGTACS